MSREVFRVQPVLAEGVHRMVRPLTHEPQTSYPRAGVLFMDEGQGEIRPGTGPEAGRAQHRTPQEGIGRKSSVKQPESGNEEAEIARTRGMLGRLIRAGRSRPESSEVGIEEHVSEAEPRLKEVDELLGGLVDENKRLVRVLWERSNKQRERMGFRVDEAEIARQERFIESGTPPPVSGGSGEGEAEGEGRREGVPPPAPRVSGEPGEFDRGESRFYLSTDLKFLDEAENERKWLRFVRSDLEGEGGQQIDYIKMWGGDFEEDEGTDFTFRGTRHKAKQAEDEGKIEGIRAAWSDPEFQANAVKLRELKLQEVIQGYTAADKTKTLAKKLAGLPKEEQIKELRAYLIPKLAKQLSPANQWEGREVNYLFESDEALEYAFFRIINTPLDAETTPYSLGFYEGINLKGILDRLKARADHEPQSAPGENTARYRRYGALVEGISHLHNMNMLIVTGNINEFVQTARNITPEQLQVLEMLPGVAAAKRVIESEFLRVLARDGKITSLSKKGGFGNYEELVGGLRRGQDGKDVYHRGTIAKRLESVFSNSEEGKKLEDWQRRMGGRAGLDVYNMFLRAAEIISLSNTPEEMGNETFASFPQESAAKLMNWFGWSSLRYKYGESRGGLWIAKKAIDIFQKDREQQGYGKTSLAKIGNHTVEDFELPGMFGVSGFNSSWRQALVYLKHSPMFHEDPDVPTEHQPQAGEEKGETISIYDYYHVKKEVVSRRRKAEFARTTGKTGKALDREWSKAKNGQIGAEILREVFIETDKDGKLVRDERGQYVLRAGFNNALGILLKQSSILPEDRKLASGSEELRQAKEDIRTAIWQRVTDENPIAIATLLGGAEFQGKAGGEASGRLQELQHWLNPEKSKSPEKLQVWESLSGKLIVANDIRLMNIKNGEQNTLDQVLASVSEEMKLTPVEKELLESIRTSGKEMAREFANIRFPFTPFMNDVIFENAQHSEAGSEAYRRRTAGDLPAFNESYEKLTQLMMNPGAIPPEKVIETLLGMVEALGTPQGTDAGQDKVFPILETIMRYYETGGWKKTGFGKFWYKQSAFVGVMHLLNKPTSVAQSFAGTDAPSFDESGMKDFVEKNLKAGVVRRERKDENGNILAVDLYDRLKKRFKLPTNWLMAIISAFKTASRDLTPIVIVGAAGAVFSETPKAVKQRRY